MAINDLLLDTHAFLWAISDDPRLSDCARKLYLASNNRLHFSVASVWEMAIKCSLGKLTLAKPLRAFLDEQLPINHIKMLNIHRGHAERVESLPLHHRDPFDRLLVAQATYERMPLLSCDATLDHYAGLQRVW